MKRALPLITLLMSCVLTPAMAATVYTGDRVDGFAVIDKLDSADFKAGSVTKLYFRVSDQSIGQGWYVPVVVIKGAKPGPKLLLTAAIHGDELNGIPVVQQIITDTDPHTLNGTIIAVPGLNTPGLLHSTRQFTPNGHGSGGENLNRILPGDLHGGAANIYAARLWSNLFMGNVDISIDLHTQSAGISYPMYVFAETSGARHLADLIRPDVINMDPGIDGTVENTLNAYGFTSVTLELGVAESFDSVMIARGVKGIINVMRDQGMVAGTPDLSGPEPFLGNEILNVKAPRGGFAHVVVKLGDTVKAGDAVATITNAYGDVVAKITAPRDGQVLSVATDPRRDPGDTVARLIYWNDKGACAATGCPVNKKAPATTE
ncbi:M14 family metallopeptidase [Asticcacaulis sp. ZE23SCel15]|uniref:succinylglutamate desuccinylase/aspartoacylase family protein n=1 Tax=Asticcacaulis sp. ZE23SCel15 TaxID=3059027 RepID=UPI00266014ED|nr:succinylglutamate desuccinylase/aspartoacylase family protein [Asticcacaulis sp. ZE23SCel15]WKL57105.1 M14 family metallopeptidase [Asticcacaulis sp. ZE23SCel15]